MRRLVLLVTLIVVVAACGDDDDGASIFDATTAPPTAADGTTTAPASATTGQSDQTTPETAATTSTAAATTSSEPATTLPSGPLPEDVVLEIIRQQCENGDFLMCDLLYQASPFDSFLEAYGDSCGDRNDPTEFCADLYDVERDLTDFRQRCSQGDMVGCDYLYLYSPFGSDDEAFGDSCGGLGDPGQACVLEYGFTTG